MSCWFASDLHLDPTKPEIAARFLHFLAGPVQDARALYLLGDLFEAWIGDDDPEPAHRAVIAALASLAAGGMLVYVMRGNRDFLIGERFCRDSGAILLDDPAIVTIEGERALLSHGDGLCVDDGAYQRLRALVQDPGLRRGFARLPLASRHRLAAEARAGSREHLAVAADYITDVNQSAVESLLRDAGVSLLIHGHTHRPAIHEFPLGSAAATRIVLGDWHATAMVLHWDHAGRRLVPCPC
ncbi:MAG: UDP-2,3-diacylglucosamine diphosphatase [Steroidobacteraceae bacterium]